MNARKSTAALPDEKAGGNGWAPRLAQEARLAALDVRLARPNDDTVSLEIERAVLLGALNRHQEYSMFFRVRAYQTSNQNALQFILVPRKCRKNLSLRNKGSFLCRRVDLFVERMALMGISTVARSWLRRIKR